MIRRGTSSDYRKSRRNTESCIALIRYHGLQMRDKFCRALADMFCREANHTKRRDFVQGSAQISSQGKLQRGDCEFVNTQSSKKRIASDAFHDFFFPRDNSGLRAAE